MQIIIQLAYVALKINVIPFANTCIGSDIYINEYNSAYRKMAFSDFTTIAGGILDISARGSIAKTAQVYFLCARANLISVK